MQIPNNVVQATLDVSPLYTNIPQKEGIEVICSYYEDHYEQKLPILTRDLRKLMRIISEENSSKFNENHFVQTHGMANKNAGRFLRCFLGGHGKTNASG